MADAAVGYLGGVRGVRSGDGPDRTVVCTDRADGGGAEAEGEEETAASNSTLALSAARAADRGSFRIAPVRRM